MRVVTKPRPTTARDELALVERMLAGDRDAMETFADHYSPGLYRFALRRLSGDRDLTGDIVQTTLCKALTKLRSYRGEAALLTWLCACCRNEIAMHFRRKSRPFEELELDEGAVSIVSSPNLPGNGGPEQNLLRKESEHLVHLALDHLPAHYSRALEWKYLERLPVKEIATRLEMGPKAAESLLTRARGAFREIYECLTQPPEHDVFAVDGDTGIPQP